MADRLLIVAGILLCLSSMCSVRGQNLVQSRNNEEQWRPRSRSTVCVPRDCKLPDCYCTGKTGPSHLRNYQIPQMVMLTFDDAINEQVYDYYDKIFNPVRKNPNGCPISATFYLSHNWTNYDMVREMYKTGHEIASHSVTHRLPQSWWTHASLKDWYKEVEGQRKNIASKSGIPKSSVRGMRVPFLELGGDKQFTMMQDVGITYDSSFMTGPYDEGGAWPFTLDYPPNWKYCSNNNCPKASFPGVWELPMNRWIGPDGKPCPMVDACETQPVDKEDALGYMWYNFNRFYRGNRAPFGIHLHAVWFKKDDSYVDALGSFLDALADMDDVYLVSASQVVEWMRKPTSVKDINSFMPWRKSCLSADGRNPSTPPPQRRPTTKRSTTSTTPTTTTTDKVTTTEALQTTSPDEKPLSTPSRPRVQDQQPRPRQPVQHTQNTRYENNRVEQFNGESRNNIPVWSDNQPTNHINQEDNRVAHFGRPPYQDSEQVAGFERPPNENNEQGLRFEGPPSQDANRVPQYNGPPHQENFYPVAREERLRPGEPDAGHPNPRHPPAQWQPEAVLRENIQVNIDLDSSKHLDKPTILKQDPKQNQLDTVNRKNTIKNTNEKNAYGASKGEATSVDKPLYQSSLSAASTEQKLSRTAALVGSIAWLCLTGLLY